MYTYNAAGEFRLDQDKRSDSRVDHVERDVFLKTLCYSEEVPIFQLGLEWATEPLQELLVSLSL